MYNKNIYSFCAFFSRNYKYLAYFKLGMAGWLHAFSLNLNILVATAMARTYSNSTQQPESILTKENIYTVHFIHQHNLEALSRA